MNLKMMRAVIFTALALILVYISKVYVWDPTILSLSRGVAKLEPYMLPMMILSPLVGILFILVVYRIKNPKVRSPKPTPSSTKKEKDSSEGSKLHWPLKEDATFLLFGWTFLLLLPLFFGDKGSVEFSLRDWWWNHITTEVGIALIIGFTLYGWMMYADPKKPFRYKLANWGTTILVLVSLVYLFGDKIPSFGDFTSRFGSEVSGKTRTTEIKLGRAETQDFVTKFWYSNLPVIDAREMINIAQAESGFNHFDGNGNVLRGVENPDDIGVMQINQEIWGNTARELGYNIDDLHGNLQMALYIRKEKGPSAWTTHKKVSETSEIVENIVAPVGDWSPVQKVKANCIWRVDRVVKVKDDQDRVHEFLPGQTLNVITWTFQISVPDEPPGNMELRCTPP